jgi:hypothetical protein
VKLLSLPEINIIVSKNTIPTMTSIIEIDLIHPIFGPDNTISIKNYKPIYLTLAAITRIMRVLEEVLGIDRAINPGAIYNSPYNWSVGNSTVLDFLTENFSASHLEKLLSAIHRIQSMLESQYHANRLMSGQIRPVVSSNVRTYQANQPKVKMLRSAKQLSNLIILRSQNNDPVFCPGYTLDFHDYVKRKRLGKQKTITYLGNGIDISLAKYLQSVITEIHNSQEKSISTPTTTTARIFVILIESIMSSNKVLRSIIEKITSGEILKASTILGVTEEEIYNLIHCNLDMIKGELLTLNPEQEVSLVDAVPNNNNNQVNLTPQTLIL